MQIALIDDGINNERFPNLKVVEDLSVFENTINARKSEELLLTDHGTTCARIINRYSTGVEFISLRLFHDINLKTSCEQLLTAFRWCLHKRVPIIHLSLGTNFLNDYYLLKPLVAEAISQNQVVIAACSNRDEISYPAAIGGVLAVKADSSLEGDQYFVEISGENHFLFRASAYHKLIEHDGRFLATQLANSYAAPTITAKVHNILQHFDERSMPIKKIFQALAGEEIEPSFYRPDFIWKARIMNPGKFHLLEEHVFFQLIDNPEESVKSDLLLIPASKVDGPCGAGSENNILIAGMDKSLATQNHNLMWSENDLRKIEVDGTRSLDDIDCPFIQIVGSEIEMIQGLCLLRDAFVEDGYQCLAVSDISHSYLYGIEYQENLSKNLLVMGSMVSLYRPDVTLFATRDGKINENIKDLLNVHINSGRSTGILRGKNGFFLNSPESEEGKKLFDAILERLE